MVGFVNARRPRISLDVQRRYVADRGDPQAHHEILGLPNERFWTQVNFFEFRLPIDRHPIFVRPERAARRSSIAGDGVDSDEIGARVREPTVDRFVVGNFVASAEAGSAYST